MAYFEKGLDSERVYDGKILHIRKDRVELHDGSTASREVIEHPGGVCVLALDSEDNLLMVRQFRYAMAEELLELPAGKLSPGEDPADCGRRELKEETGYEAGQYEFLCRLYPTPAYDSEVIHVYFASDLTYRGQQLDPGEYLDVVKIPFEEALEMVLSNRINDAKTQIGILKYKLLRDGNRLSK